MWKECGERQLADTVIAAKYSTQNSQYPIPYCTDFCVYISWDVHAFPTYSASCQILNAVYFPSFQTKSVIKAKFHDSLRMLVFIKNLRSWQAWAVSVSAWIIRIQLIENGQWKTNLNGFWRNWSLPNLKRNPEILLHGLRKSTKHVSQDRWCLSLPFPLHQPVGPQRTLASTRCEGSELDCSIERGWKRERSRFMLREFGA